MKTIECPICKNTLNIINNKYDCSKNKKNHSFLVLCDSFKILSYHLSLLENNNMLSVDYYDKCISIYNVKKINKNSLNYKLIYESYINFDENIIEQNVNTIFEYFKKVIKLQSFI